MRKILVIITILIAGLPAFSQKVNEKVWDDDLNKKILVGKCTREGLEEGKFGDIFKEGYDAYTPDSRIIQKLREKLSNNDSIHFMVIFGVWCSDSQREVPRFFKVMDESGVDKDKIDIYAVNRRKQGVTVDLSKYDVNYVPLFIVYENNVEKGRIIESPEDSIEQDILNFIQY